MLIFLTRPPTSAHAALRPAYAEAWAIREFTGSVSDLPLRDAVARHGLSAQWLDDPAGWRALETMWRRGTVPADLGTTTLRGSLSGGLTGLARRALLVTLRSSRSLAG